MRIIITLLFLFNTVLVFAQGQFYYVDKAGVYSLEKVENYFGEIDLKKDNFLFISNNTEPLVCRSNVMDCINRIGDIIPQIPSINYELDTLVVLLENYLKVNPKVDWHFFIDHNSILDNHFEVKLIQRLILVFGDHTTLDKNNVYIHIDKTSLSETHATALKNKNYIYGDYFKVLLY